MTPGRLLALAATLVAIPAPPARAQDPFPPAAAAEVGLSDTALEGLAGVVAGWVDDGSVVGAELLVVARRRTVLHRAWGWSDREARVELEPGAVFNLRSMTKPVLGTAAQVLFDEGLVAPADPVAAHLTPFEGTAAGAITVEQLLTHRSGLGWNVCMDGPSLEALAECCAQVGPREFVPGTSFLYSNAGSNVLGAALARAAQGDLAELLDGRVLAPLGMDDTFALDRDDDPRTGRMPARYVRTEEGTWERSWGPADGAPLDFLQGAQGLGGTAQDYARLLALWMDGGAHEGRRLLTEEAVRRGLRPASLTGLPTTFPGRRVYYGQHWTLWSPGSSGEVEAFGHGGSDGTFAWAWPGRDLMVLYLTASVNTSTGIALEREIDRWLLDAGEPEVPAPLRPFVGHYWNEPKGLIRSVYVDAAGEPWVDVVGTAAFRLEPTDDPLRFGVAGRSGFDVRFERAEDGSIARLVPPQVTGEVPSERLRADASLPSVDELVALRLGEDDPVSPGDLGVFRMSGTFTHSSGLEGTDVLVSDGELRSREEVARSERGPEVTICNGRRAGTLSRRGRLRELSGSERDRTLLARMSVVSGDWRRFFDRLEVVARTQREGRDVLFVRVQGGEAPPCTFVVDAVSGLPVEVLDTVDLPFGAMGKRTRLEDWRQVEGVWLPFRWVGSFAEESMGVVTVQYERIETHVEPAPDAFELVARERR
jgi:CubicO group peptidase (beta-lactamase class C family)